MSTRLFDARYPGRCDANGCRIEEGDRITTEQADAAAEAVTDA